LVENNDAPPRGVRIHFYFTVAFGEDQICEIARAAVHHAVAHHDPAVWVPLAAAGLRLGVVHGATRGETVISPGIEVVREAAGALVGSSWSHSHAFVYVHRRSRQCGDAGHGREHYSSNYYPDF
jgi:hypothetical protein